MKICLWFNDTFYRYYNAWIYTYVQICLRTATVFCVFKVSTAVFNAEGIYHAYFRNNVYLKVSQLWSVLILEACLFLRLCLILRIYGTNDNAKFSREVFSNEPVAFSWFFSHNDMVSLLSKIYFGLWWDLTVISNYIGFVSMVSTVSNVFLWALKGAKTPAKEFTTASLRAIWHLTLR